MPRLPPIDMGDGTSRIVLTQGRFALVDTLSVGSLAEYSWHAVRAPNTWYACANAKSGIRRVYMHRLLAGAPEGRDVDHVNGDGLDNRSSNIRPCDTSENACNCRLRKDNTSGYKGVSWHSAVGKWVAEIRLRNRKIVLGYFLKIDDAAAAYARASAELHGEFARLS